MAQTARRDNQDKANDVKIADTLAWAYYAKGIYGMARDLLEDAVRESPDNATYHYHLGMVCIKLLDKPNAQLHLKKVIALAPNSPTARDAQSALSSLK